MDNRKYIGMDVPARKSLRISPDEFGRLSGSILQRGKVQVNGQKEGGAEKFALTLESSPDCILLR